MRISRNGDRIFAHQREGPEKAVSEEGLMKRMFPTLEHVGKPHKARTVMNSAYFIKQNLPSTTKGSETRMTASEA